MTPSINVILLPHHPFHIFNSRERGASNHSIFPKLDFPSRISQCCEAKISVFLEAGTGRREREREGGRVGRLELRQSCSTDPSVFGSDVLFQVGRDKAGKKDTNYCQHLLGHVFITHKLKDKRKEILNPFPDF